MRPGRLWSMESLDRLDFARGAIWCVPGLPVDTVRDGRHWSAERDLFAVVLCADDDCSRVRVVLAATADEVERARVGVDPTSVELNAGDTDADLGSYAVIDCSNVNLFTDRLFHRGERIGSIATAAKMRAIDEAVIRGLQLGLYGDFDD